MDTYEIPEEIMTIYQRQQIKSVAHFEYFKNLEKKELHLTLELGLYGGERQKQFDRVKELQKLKLEKDDLTKTEMLWITINPRPDVPFDEIKKCMMNIIRKKWLKRYVYVYEQRGEDEDHIGDKPHIHLLLYRDGKKPSHAITEIKNTVKYITNVNHDEIFHVKYVKSNDHNVVNLLNYMLGKKGDESKHKKQEIDILFRQKYNLKSFYSVGIDAEALLSAET